MEKIYSIMKRKWFYLNKQKNSLFCEKLKKSIFKSFYIKNLLSTNVFFDKLDWP
jgi:hypothetical protein